MARDKLVLLDDDANKAFNSGGKYTGGVPSPSLLEHHEIAAACIWYDVNYAPKDNLQDCWLWEAWRSGRYGK